MGCIISALFLKLSENVASFAAGKDMQEKKGGELEGRGPLWRESQLLMKLRGDDGLEKRFQDRRTTQPLGCQGLVPRA